MYLAELGWCSRSRPQPHSCHLRLAPGSKEEGAVIGWIFHQFVVEQKFETEIARELNEANVVSQHGRPWTDTMIHKFSGMRTISEISFTIARHAGSDRISSTTRATAG